MAADTASLLAALNQSLSNSTAAGKAALVAIGSRPTSLSQFAAPTPTAAPSAGPLAAASSTAAGPGGETNAQMIQGFKDAGRPDLAAMVGTPAWNTWTGAESGGRADAVSPANNQGKPNGGILQFWAGHAWAAPYFQGGKFTMTPYQQAQAAAKNFHLTPQKINGYAAQIGNHSYRGWG